jgi:hypothetical protein
VFSRKSFRILSRKQHVRSGEKGEGIQKVDIGVDGFGLFVTLQGWSRDFHIEMNGETSQNQAGDKRFSQCNGRVRPEEDS